MIQIFSRKYFSEWGNGSTFASNLSDFAKQLKGLAGERIKSVTKVQAALISTATQSDPFEIVNGYLLQRGPGGSFIEDGFEIGQSCALIQNYEGIFGSTTASVAWTDTIIALSHSEIQFSSAIGGPNTLVDHALVCVDKFPALEYKFGLIENNETDDFTSRYTDDIQSYYFGAIDTTTPTEHAMTVFGGLSASKSWNSGTATVKYISSSSPVSVGIDYAHLYEITHTFVINPIFLEGYLDALENGTQPEDYVGTNSLKHICEYTFKYVLTNPNTSVRIVDSENLGATGWFGENFNGLNNIYSVLISSYRDSLTDTVVDGLQLKRKTKVTGTITGSGFTNTSKAGAYFFYAAPLERYSALQPSFQDTFLYDSKILKMVSGTILDTGTSRIKRFKIDYVNATTLTFELDIEFTDNETNYINPAALEEVDNKYFIGIQVGNTNPVDTSNKVILQADWAPFVINNDVEDLCTFTSQSFYDHGMDTSGAGYTDYKGWKQDGFIYKSTLNLNKALNANLKSLTVRLIAYNTVTGNSFELQKYGFDLSDAVVVNIGTGYQQLYKDTTRGFFLKAGDEFNRVVIDFDSPVDDSQAVYIQLGMKFDWQSWIKLPVSDTVFYDATLDSDGRGKDASRYSMNNDYEIRLAIDADISQLTSVSTRYTDLSTPLIIYDWADDGFDPAKWSLLIQTFDENDNDLSGIILRNADTRLRCTWTPLGGSTAGFNNKWAIHRLEPSLANGYDAVHELSSILPAPAGNRLKPVSGESFLKITDTGTEVVTECLIDYLRLDGGNYDPTVRLSRQVTYPRYQVARDIKYLTLDKTKLIYFNCPANGVAVTNSLRYAQLDINGRITTEDAIALNASYTYQNWKMAVAYDVINNGLPNFYAVCYTGTATQVHEFVFNGTTYTQALIYSANIGGSGICCIRIDPYLEPNGRPFIWFGNRDSNISGDKGFKTLYYDGALWVVQDFKTFTTAGPSNNEFNHPQDIIFDNQNTYIMNYDNPSQASQYNQGKIGVLYQTGGSITDPVDRANAANYTFLYNLYRNSANTQNVDGVVSGDDHDLSYALGFEILYVNADSIPVFLIVHDVSLGSGSRHFSRLLPIVATPTGEGDWSIQTPMAFTNGSSGNPQALSGSASATAQTSPLQRKGQCHILVVNENEFITGHGSAPYWVKHTIDYWDGSGNNPWFVWEPNDPTYTFTSGNTLHE